TSWPRDWSSDVCSSDLAPDIGWIARLRAALSSRYPVRSAGRREPAWARRSAKLTPPVRRPSRRCAPSCPTPREPPHAAAPVSERSEERRVGKEWKIGGG